MKITTRDFALLALLSVAPIANAGCAAPTADDQGSSVDSELVQAPATFVGTWIAAEGSSSPTRISFGANGSYKRELCLDFACEQPLTGVEQGTFSVDASRLLFTRQVGNKLGPVDFVHFFQGQGNSRLTLEENLSLDDRGTPAIFRLQRNAPPPTTTPCGPSVCGEGTVCCDALHGICAAPDAFCTQ